MRETSVEKKRVILKKFHLLLRSGKDYESGWMYEEAGRSAFLKRKSAAAIIRTHYHEVISEKMIKFVSDNIHLRHENLIIEFAKSFGLCSREARYIIRFIKHKNSKNE